MKEKKILFKYENGEKVVEIKGVNQVELMTFICEVLESLIEGGIVLREDLLTSINVCLTLDVALSKDVFEDKEIKKLIDELYDSILESSRSIKND